MSDYCENDETAEFLRREDAAPAQGEPQQVCWFHGTSADKVATIQREGFREGTWFGKHIEDALKFGGPYIFVVKVTFADTPMEWQACSSNAIPSSAIQDLLYIASQPPVAQGLEEMMLAAIPIYKPHDYDFNEGFRKAAIKVAINHARQSQKRIAELERELERLCNDKS